MSDIGEGVILESPLDMHVHFRQDEMLKIVAPITASMFSGALIMPNTVPPIKTYNDLKNYKFQVESSFNGFFQSYHTLFLHEGMVDPAFFMAQK